MLIEGWPSSWIFVALRRTFKCLKRIRRLAVLIKFGHRAVLRSQNGHILQFVLCNNNIDGGEIRSDLIKDGHPLMDAERL